MLHQPFGWENLIPKIDGQRFDFARSKQLLLALKNSTIIVPLELDGFFTYHSQYHLGDFGSFLRGRHQLTPIRWQRCHVMKSCFVHDLMMA